MCVAAEDCFFFAVTEFKKVDKPENCFRRIPRRITAEENLIRTVLGYQTLTDARRHNAVAVGGVEIEIAPDEVFLRCVPGAYTAEMSRYYGRVSKYI